MRKALTMLGAFAALALGSLVAAAPAQAVTCHNTTPGTLTTWPNNPNNPNNPAVYSPVQYCETANNVLAQDAKGIVGALADLRIPLQSGTNSPADLYTKLSNEYLGRANGQLTKPQFFVFYSLAEFNTYFGKNYTNFSATAFTEKDASGTPIRSAIFLHATDRNGVLQLIPPQDVQAATLHEAGHWADSFYKSQVGGTLFVTDSAAWRTLLNYDWDHTGGIPANVDGINQQPTCDGAGALFTGYSDQFKNYICRSSQRVTIGGTVTPGDILKIKVSDAAIPGGFLEASYTVQSGNNVNAIAAGLAAAINTAPWTSQKFAASVSSAVITITVGSGDFTFTSSKSAGATETISFSNPQRGTGGGTTKFYDGYTNREILETGYPGVYGVDGTTEVATFGGTVTPGDSLTITVTDPDLLAPPAGPVSVTIQAVLGDTPTSLAAKMATEINNNGTLSGKAFKAVASGTQLQVFSPSGKATSYTRTLSAGATETLTVTVPYGRHKHLIAEALNVTMGYVDTGNSGASHYLQSSRFKCVKSLIDTLRKTGTHPTNATLTTLGCPNIAGW